MALNPDIEALLEMVRDGQRNGKRRPLHLLTPEQARADFDMSSVALDEPPCDVESVQDLRIPVRGGAVVAARLYNAGTSDGPRPLLVYFHGGGYMVGGLDSHDSLCRALAAQTPCAVLSVAYRLAPEHRFPVAVEDAEDTLHWLREHGATHGLDVRRLALGGDSAGATLATVLATLARDNPSWLPAAPRMQVLIYPGVAARQDTDSHARYGQGYLLEGETIQWFYEQYLRGPDDRDDWRFAPLLTRELSGVAPALMILAECDPLVDEGRQYAERLDDAGVPVTLCVYPGMIHEFLRMGNMVAEAGEARTRIAQALARAMRD